MSKQVYELRIPDSEPCDEPGGFIVVDTTTGRAFSGVYQTELEAETHARCVTYVSAIIIGREQNEQNQTMLTIHTFCSEYFGENKRKWPFVSSIREVVDENERGERVFSWYMIERDLKRWLTAAHASELLGGWACIAWPTTAEEGSEAP